jgi:penicillin-binding protein 2
VSTIETNNRQIHIIAILIIAILILVIKAASIQLFNESYVAAADNTTISDNVLHPPRGLIYDRNGKLLVVNKPAYDIKVIFNGLNPKMDTTLFCSLLNISKEKFVKNITKNWRSARYSKSVPFTFLSNLSPEQYAAFQEHLFEFPGFYSELRNVRAYPHKNAAHVLGYISEVSRKVVDEENSVYSPGDYIGVSGIEKEYESFLRGEKGVEYLLKNNLGRQVGELKDGKLNVEPTPGIDLISSLDLDLQAYGEELFNNKLGSVVAIEPETGEILCMLSGKTYDPSLLSINKDRGRAFDALLNDTLNKPFLDRSIMAKYPPGSIIKPILALIAMQEGVAEPNRTIYCTGEYAVNSKGFTQGCHLHPTPYNVEIAIQHSCNSYFYQLIRELIEINGYSNPDDGLRLYNDYLRAFGLGDKLGADVSRENKGHLPSPMFYDKLYDDVISGWKSTYILSLGIGQGEMELTTIQMANLAASLANRGYYITPHLVKGLQSNTSEENPELVLKKRTLPIDKPYFEPVINGMEKVVISGTARNAAIPNIEVCGKTGTSQNPHGKDHSVFFAFAPKDNPKIAIAVFVENAGWGSDFAAPIAGLMIEKYLTGEISDSKKWMEERMLSLSTITPNP